MMYTIEKTVFETERLMLREINSSDINDIQEMYSQKEILLYTNSEIDLNVTPFFITKDKALNMIESWAKDKEHLCWGIELRETKKLVGRVYLYGFTGNQDIGYRVDIGYSLSKGYWGRGYITEAVRKVVDYGFSSLNIVRIQAEIIPENVASIRVCEKIGFTNEGTLHKYALYDNNGQCFKDIVMMALTRRTL